MGTTLIRFALGLAAVAAFILMWMLAWNIGVIVGQGAFEWLVR